MRTRSVGFSSGTARDKLKGYKAEGLLTGFASDRPRTCDRDEAAEMGASAPTEYFNDEC
jgi:hypothetical protein